MAEPVIPGVTAETVTQVTTSVFDIIIWLIIILALAAIIFFLWYYLRHNKRVVVLEHMGNGKKPRIHPPDRAREVRQKNGVVKWKLMFNKITMSKPPDESVYYDHRGRLTALAYIIDDNIIWAYEKDFGISENNLREIRFQPFKGEDKATLAHEYRQAEDYKKKRIADLLMQLGPMVGIIIIITLLLIFAGDFMKSVSQPAQEMGNKLTQVVDRLDTMIEGGQVIQVNREETPASSEPPN